MKLKFKIHRGSTCYNIPQRVFMIYALPTSFDFNKRRKSYIKIIATIGALTRGEIGENNRCLITKMLL